MMPKVSIIVPVYNAEKFLHRCINSILSQSLSDIELLLIDDGSTDLSGKICDNYSNVDKRIIVIHQENKGVSSARNKGLSIAKGRYIGFVDADDYIEKDMYEKMYSYAVLNHADICCCGFFREEKQKKYIKQCEKDIIYTNLEQFLSEYFRQDKESGIGSGNWNKIFKKNLISDDRYLFYTNGEDIEFQIRQFVKCNTICMLSEPLYHYMCLSNELSATNKKVCDSYFGILDIADCLIKKILPMFPILKQEIYAFHLTWYMASVQKIYSEKDNRYLLSYKRRIRKDIIKNYNKYLGNRFVKRLDLYYMFAMIFRIVVPANILRKYIIIIREKVKK